jgi:hypothetical protein
VDSRFRGNDCDLQRQYLANHINAAALRRENADSRPRKKDDVAAFRVFGNGSLAAKHVIPANHVIPAQAGIHRFANGTM